MNKFYLGKLVFRSEMRRILILRNNELFKHNFGSWHPLKSERMNTYFKLLEEKSITNLANVKVLDTSLIVNDEDILTVHDESLLNLIKSLSIRGGALDSDTPVPPGTYDRARIQAGGLIEGALRVLNNEYDVAIQCVAFGGHHATRRHVGFSFGFCYFNQEAILIRYLQRRKYVERILVLDCDAHHGNGIQEIFYSDPTVLYISLHQDPNTLYPGTGFIHEIGEDKGLGYNINIPLPPGTSDENYIKALNEVFKPIAYQFKPNIILWIFGADTYFADPLTSLNLTMNGYSRITDIIMDVGDKLCSGKLIVEFGGGYDILSTSLAFYLVTARLAGLNIKIDDPYSPPKGESEAISRRVETLIVEIKKTLSKYWLLE
ncbi:MAG: histone deacetylase [Candidatus Methanomethylicia archaeon]